MCITVSLLNKPRLCLATLGVLVYSLIHNGWPRLNGAFLVRTPSMLRPATAGILSSLVGTALIMLVTACTAIPLGVAAGLTQTSISRVVWSQRIESTCCQSGETLYCEPSCR